MQASFPEQQPQVILICGFAQLTIGAIGISLSFSFWSFLLANLVRSGSTSIIQVGVCRCPACPGLGPGPHADACAESGRRTAAHLHDTFPVRGSWLAKVYSSLILQNLVAEDLRGRVFTYEFVVMTICNCLAEVCPAACMVSARGSVPCAVDASPNARAGGGRVRPSRSLGVSRLTSGA